ncbi:RNA polymerase sigma factor [Syntrophomonas wolfei]|uniref:RNA polymerase sigma factor n=1 Tax=Syntrophomonas wolfei TaxID=863 RepID=UPI0023F4F311|nr:sigma-70 family RNA polymerase sigma factor [Syntrophomonas wolfei]
MAEEDRQLVIKCRDRQEQAYHELMRRYEGYIYHLCRSMTGNREDALDLTQETFIRVFQGLDSYQLNRPFRPWLRQIAINTCVNFLQRHSSAPLFLDQPLGDGKLTLADTVASPEDPAREIEWREAGRFLQEALNRLPQAYRLLIVLRHQEGMSYREIAEQTGVPLGTVKTHLFRARAALRKEFSTYYAWE